MEVYHGALGCCFKSRHGVPVLSRGECLLTDLTAVLSTHSCSESSLFHWSVRLRRDSRNGNQALRRLSRCHLWPGAGSEGGWDQRGQLHVPKSLQFKLFLGQDWNNSSPFSPCSFLRLWLVFVAWGTSASRILVWIWIQLWPRILVSLPLCSHTDLHPQPFPDSCRTQGHTPGLLSPEQDTGVSRT